MSVAKSQPRGWLDDALGIAVLVGMAVALYLIFLWVPSDSLQGPVQRIFYFHLASVWNAYLAFFLVFVTSILYLRKASRGKDRFARAWAEIGVVFTTITLVSGSLWAKPIWGTYWSWDARLTSTLILWLIYVVYLLIRSFVTDEERAGRYAAIVGIIGFLDVPIVHMSVRWWRTLHPQPVVANLTGPDLPASMWYTVLFSILVFTLLAVYLVRQRLQTEELRDSVVDLRESLVR
jgi:heme exporter protein C